VFSTEEDALDLSVFNFKFMFLVQDYLTKEMIDDEKHMKVLVRINEGDG
jgi:hypothetical protein